MRKNRQYRNIEHKKSANTAKARERAAAWAKENPERVRENKRRFNAAHPDAHREYYRKNRARILEGQKARRAGITSVT